jgi:hypothetical protein
MVSSCLSGFIDAAELISGMKCRIEEKDDVGCTLLNIGLRDPGGMLLQPPDGGRPEAFLMLLQTAVKYQIRPC